MNTEIKDPTTSLYMHALQFLSQIQVWLLYNRIFLLLLVRQMEIPVSPMKVAVHRRSLRLPYSLRATGLCTAVQGLRFSCYSWAPEPRHPVHVTDVYATESRTPLVRELSADRFSVGLLLHCSPPSRVRAGEWAKVCGGQALLWSAASAEKQRIFFLFRLQPTRHRYSLTHSTAHMNSCQSTK